MNKYYNLIASVALKHLDTQVSTCTNLSEAQLGIITVTTAMMILGYAACCDVNKNLVLFSKHAADRGTLWQPSCYYCNNHSWQNLLLNESKMNRVHQSRLNLFSFFETCSFLFSIYFIGPKTVVQSLDSKPELILLLWMNRKVQTLVRSKVFPHTVFLYVCWDWRLLPGSVRLFNILSRILTLSDRRKYRKIKQTLWCSVMTLKKKIRSSCDVIVTRPTSICVHETCVTESYYIYLYWKKFKSWESWAWNFSSSGSFGKKRKSSGLN